MHAPTLITRSYGIKHKSKTRAVFPVKNRQLLPKSWIHPELCIRLEDNTLSAIGIDEKIRLSTCTTYDEIVPLVFPFLGEQNDLPYTLVPNFSHNSVNFYVTILKSEETRASEHPRSFQNCRWICLLKSVSLRPGRTKIASFFSLKKRRGIKNKIAR